MSASDLAVDFARDGAVVLRGVLSPHEVATLDRGIETNLGLLSANAKVASSSDDPGRFVEDFCCWQINADYRALIWTSALPQWAAYLTDSERVRLYHDHMLTKSAGTRQSTPWHQDQPYYNIDGTQTVSFWIPADPVPRDATLEFVAGSHRGPWLMPRSFMDDQAKWFPEGTLAELPDVDGDPGRYPVIGWELEPGDVVAFNMLTLHRAAGSGANRRVLSLRFIGDDVRHAPRSWTTSPDYPGLAARLAAGSEMADPLFPLVWAAGKPCEMPR